MNFVLQMNKYCVNNHNIYIRPNNGLLAVVCLCYRPVVSKKKIVILIFVGPCIIDINDINTK